MFRLSQKKRQESFERDQKQKKANGSAGSPRKEIPITAVHHANQRICRFIDNWNFIADVGCDARRFPLLKTILAITHQKNDHSFVDRSGSGKRIRRGMSRKLNRNGVNDCSRCDGPTKQESGVHLSRGITEPKKGDCGKELENKREAKDFFTACGKPGGLRKRGSHIFSMR
jgi:hypothetical protein